MEIIMEVIMEVIMEAATAAMEAILMEMAATTTGTAVLAVITITQAIITKTAI